MQKTNAGYVCKYGYLDVLLREIEQFCDAKETAKDEDGFIVSPLTMYQTRVKYKILEFDVLMDSTNMLPSDWIIIASKIEKNYNDYDSFIILHGTDTMAFSGSALSFMLENLAKTVVITGSQIPLAETRNDAFDNLMGSLMIAGHFTIPEVMIYFRGNLLRGNRCKKVDSMSLKAFNSPNFPALGTAGICFSFRDDLLLDLPENSFKVMKNMNIEISTLKITPCFPKGIIQSMVTSNPDIRGVVVELYGVGNFPMTRQDLLDELNEANN